MSASDDFKDAILKDAAHRTAMERQATTPSFTALLESIVARRAEMTKAASESKADLVAEQGRLKPEEPYEIVKNLYYNLTESTKKAWRDMTKKFESLVGSAKTISSAVPKNIVGEAGKVRVKALFGPKVSTPFSRFDFDRNDAFQTTLEAIEAFEEYYDEYVSDIAMIDSFVFELTRQHAAQVTALETNLSYPTLATDARYIELKASLEAVAKLEQDIVNSAFGTKGITKIHAALKAITLNDLKSNNNIDPFYDIIIYLCNIGEAVADAAIVERDMIQAIGSSGEGRIMKANKDLLRAVQSIEDALWSTAATKTEITDRLIKNQFEATRVRAEAVKAAGTNQPDATINNAYNLASDPKPTTAEIDKGLLGSRPGFEGLR
jgi:hypothetical protein